jgi:hypothetical protein
LPAFVVGYKHSGSFYIGGMNFEAADFPVYCHDNYPIDTSTVPAVAGDNRDSVFLFIYELAYPNSQPNKFSFVQYSHTGYNFICEDV